MRKLTILLALIAIFSVITVNAQDIKAYIWWHDNVSDGADISRACNVVLLGGEITDISPDFNENKFYGADMINGVWYAIGADSEMSSPYVFSTIDKHTGEPTIINADVQFSDDANSPRGLAYDNETGIMYLVAMIDYQSGGTTHSSLYTIDLDDGITTFVGNIGDELLIKSLACDNDGNLWGVETENDELYSIDKATGAGTSIGSVAPANPYYTMQDLAYDRNNDVLYYFDDTDFYTVNRTTGATTHLFATDKEMAAFVIPVVYSASFTVTDGTATPINDATVNIYYNTTLVATQQTEADGTIIFESVEIDDYNFEVIKSGYDTYTGVFTIDNDNEIINVTLTGGVSVNNLNENNISIYPNPSNGVFTLDFKTSTGLLNVSITDITGKIILNEQLTINNEQFVINKKGIYFINIRTETGIYTEKIIIQ